MPWVAAVIIGSVIVASILSLVAMQRLWHDVFWGPKMTVYRSRLPAAVRSDESKDDLVPLPDSVRIPTLDLRAGRPDARPLARDVLLGPARPGTSRPAPRRVGRSRPLCRGGGGR